MKILFVWTGVTSYMADCWRKLQQLPDAELKIIVEQAKSGKDFNASTVLRDLDYVLVDAQTLKPSNLRSFQSFSPDVIFAGGWRSRNTRRIVDAFPDVGKVFCLDMPWRWQLRCILARFVLWRFLHKFDRIYVPGAWSAKYARWLGFRPSRIERKLYSVDFEKCGGLNTTARTTARTGFLYLGRFASEKRIDILLKAFQRYRERGGTWDLDLYGAGTLPTFANPSDFLHVHPFAQPDEIPGIYRSHACLVMASAFDPWPLVILESRAAGLDVVASNRCGNGEELGVRRVPFGDVEAMAREMIAVEEQSKEEGGRVQRTADGSYDCKAWARRTLEIAKRTIRINGWCPGMEDSANGMAVVARLLAQDGNWRNEYIVHGLWQPRGWLACVRRFGDYVRMTHGSLSPLYLRHQSRLKKRLVKPIERFLLRRAKTVLVTSETEKEWILEYEPRAKVTVVDLKKYYRFKKGEGFDGLDRTHFLYLGRRHPLKGVQYLERAVGEIAASGRKIELKIVSDAVGEEKERVWNWCDVLVLPTLSENFGLVVAEALERGKRVITTDGAPAWRGQPGVVYLEGFQKGDVSTRVRLLKNAIMCPNSAQTV